MTAAGTVVVTGAASGIGRAIALRMAADGHPVLCVDRLRTPRPGGFDDAPDAATDEVIRARGGQARFVLVDVTAMDALQVSLNTVDGRVWGAVLAAGVFERDVSILGERLDEYDRIMAVNVRAVWLGLQAVGRRLVAQGAGGRLVCLSSISGLVGLPNEPAYCASKAAVGGLVRAAALDLAEHGVTVNSVCPGFVRTSMLRADLDDSERVDQLVAATPMGRLGTPADVAHAVAFLMAAETSHVTGIALPVDGGYTAR